jgi:hypothetical protein
MTTPRRWFVTPALTQWKQMTECGDYIGPFYSFPKAEFFQPRLFREDRISWLSPINAMEHFGVPRRVWPYSIVPS